MCDDDRNRNFVDACRRSVSEKVDFAEEHSERRKLELDYAEGTGVLSQKATDFETESPVITETQSNGDSPWIADQFLY